MPSSALIVALAVSANTIQTPPPLPSLGGSFLVAPPTTMEPAFPAGSILVVEPLAGPLKRGTAVIVKNPRDASLLHALRVVALAGERVEIDDGFPVLNGTKFKDLVQFIPPSATGWANYPKWNSQFVVPRNSVYVLADNHRENAIDSLTFGAVSTEFVVGTAARWEDVLRTPGRMSEVFKRVFAGLKSKLPLHHQDGYSLTNLEVLGDTSLRFTYEFNPGTDSEIDVPSLISSLCSNRWVRQAAGMKLSYKFLRASAAHTEFQLSQAKCAAPSR